MLFVRERDLDIKRHPPTGALSLLMARIREVESSRDLKDARRYLTGSQQNLEHARDLRIHHDKGECEHSCACEDQITALESAAADFVGEFDKLPHYKKPIHITIIGHSMGTIVANELVRRNSDAHFDRIVYMAAACTIREFCSTVLTYVKSNPSAEFFNLTLHPAQEQGERPRLLSTPLRQPSAVDRLIHYSPRVRS